MRKWRKYKDEEVENFCDEIEQSIEALIWCEEVLVSIDIIDIVMVTIVILCFQWVDNRNFVLLKSWILHAFTSQCYLNTVHCYILLLWMLCIIYLNTLRAFLLTFLQLWCTRAGVTCHVSHVSVQRCRECHTSHHCIGIVTWLSRTHRLGNDLIVKQDLMSHW